MDTFILFIFLVLVMAIYKKAFTFVGFGSCLGASRSTGVSGLVLIRYTTNTSGEATTTPITNNEKALNSLLKCPVAGYRAHDEHRVNGMMMRNFFFYLYARHRFHPIGGNHQNKQHL
jgi:hypothetical protein